MKLANYLRFRKKKISPKQTYEKPKIPKANIVSNSKGQALFEFLFLFFSLFTISFALLAGFNRNIGERWKLMVQVIAKPTDSTIELR